MPKSYASTVINASADEVWHVVRDFDGLPKWHPGISTSEIEGAQPSDSVGCVRHLTVPDGSEIRERLVMLDDAERTYRYDILDGPFPVRRYRATLRVRPVTSERAAFVEWSADYDTDASTESELDTTFADGVFGTGLRGLRGRFQG